MIFLITWDKPSNLRMSIKSESVGQFLIAREVEWKKNKKTQRQCLCEKPKPNVKSNVTPTFFLNLSRKSKGGGV